MDPDHRVLLNVGLTDAGNTEGGGSSYPVGSVPWRAENIVTAGGTPMKLQVLSAMFVLPTQKHTAESLKVRWSNGATTTGGTVANPTPGWTFAFTDRKQGQNDGRGEICRPRSSGRTSRARFTESR